jgi:hypothetical protein
MKNLLLIAVLLLMYCANNSTNPNNNGNRKDTIPTTEPPTMRTQDPRLLDDWSMQYTRDSDSYSITFTSDSVDIRVIELGSRPTVSHNWYTDGGVLYINNMVGEYTGDVAFAYTIKDTTYARYAIIRERWLRLSSNDEREDMLPVLARPYTIDCNNKSVTCSGWKP